MITESKTCYQCPEEIPRIHSNLLDAQLDLFDKKFVIENIIVECSHGHKNQVCVIHDEADNNV